MLEAHFELRLPDGSIKLRKDKTVMQFKPSAYMAIEHEQMMVFVRDCRNPAKLQFAGGGIEIGTETPEGAAVRECFEEIAATVSKCTFIGQFETYEPVHLFKAEIWSTQNGYVGQVGEVSEISVIDVKDFYKSERRFELQLQFYPAQWKMLGWYLLYRYKSSSIQFPVFKLWSVDPWEILDALQ